jgi:hypothetical protein
MQSRITPMLHYADAAAPLHLDCGLPGSGRRGSPAHRPNQPIDGGAVPNDFAPNAVAGPVRSQCGSGRRANSPRAA